MLKEEYANKLSAELAAMPGDVAMYYRNMETGDSFEHNADMPMQPASVIKLPIFLRCIQLVSQGKLDPKEELVCRDEDRVGGCGALRAFRGPQAVSLETLWELMISISDNTATNLLIKRLGREALNEAFEAMGLSSTRINRLLFDSEAAARGIENEVSARDMALLLQSVYGREFEERDMSQYAEDILAGQQINHKIPGYIPSGARIAHKTGEDDGISNDVAIVYAAQPFVLCFLSNRTDVPVWERFMRKTSLELFELCGGAPEN